MKPPTWDEYIEKHGAQPKPGTELSCANSHCGATFAFPPGVRIKKYCSVTCKDACRKRLEAGFDVECPICGKAWRSPNRRYVYCSDECRVQASYAWSRKKAECASNLRPPEELILQRERQEYERKLREGLGKTAILADIIQRYAERFPASSIKPQAYSPRKKRRPETMVVCRSDLHPGLMTPSYDLDVFHARMELFTDRVLRIRDIIAETIPLEKLVVLNLGDNITGQGIYPGQAWKTERHVLEQIYCEAAPAILRQNMSWAREFPAVEEYWVPGNHGRTGKDFPDEVNFDSILAQEVAVRMEGIAHYSSYIEWGWWQYADIYGFRFLILHGHQIRSWLNIPFYGLIQKGMRWQGSMPDRWDYLVHGHFHVPFAFPWNNFEIIGNGSLVSDDDFALRELGMAGQPAQQVFGVHPEHGISWRYTLILKEDGDGAAHP